MNIERKKILIIIEESRSETIINNLIKKNDLIRESNLLNEDDLVYYPKDKAKRGKDEALKYIKGLCKQPEVTSKRIDRILIIIDADEKPKDRFNEILKSLNEQKKELRKFNIDGFPKKSGEFYRKKGKVGVGIFLFPDNVNVGCIETLCLKALKKNNYNLKEFFYCIDKYINCFCIKCKKSLTSNKKDKIKFRVFIHTINPDSYQPQIENEIDYKNNEFKNLKYFLIGK